MEAIKDLPREVQVTLGCLVLFIIFSFFDWQQVSVGPFTYGRSLWHGIGIITVLLAIAYLIWEIGRALNYNVTVGQVTPGMTSAGLAIALLVFTVITFLDWNEARHWPQWIGLLLSIAIAGVAFPRAKKEGVEMPKLPQNVNVSRSGGSAAAASTAPPPPSPPPAAPAAPEAPPAEEATPPPESSTEA